MILMASGHPGLNAFIRESAPPHVRLCDSWEDVQRLWGSAEKVFLGQRLAGFDKALEWMAAPGQKLPACELVLWVDATFEPHPSLPMRDVISLWKGEIDAVQLEDWWTIQPRGISAMEVASRWCVVTLYPYLSVEPLVSALTEWATQRYGVGGVWVDCDGGHAALSLLWRPRGYERPEYPFAERKPQRMMRRHYLIPAPPPWYPGTSDSGGSFMEGLWRQDWSWQAWFLGGQIARPEAVFAFSHMTDAVFWLGRDTTLGVIERTMEFCRLYNPKLSIRMAGELPAQLTEALMRKWEVAPLDTGMDLGHRSELRRLIPIRRRKKE